MSTVEDAITRFRGRCKIALSSDSQYDEFVIVENDADASWLVNLCDSYDQLAHQRDGLRRERDEAVAALKEAREAIRTAKAELDKNIATDAPVHPVSARLTFPLSTIHLVLAKLGGGAA